ncbi:MAG: transglycosylase domain-containing protein [Geothrix sp.]|uniref:transglycosylase domain-containing protein n=1 Tax=Geothrix sp. TaxID=1962974 RepID=UPI00183680AC|nr:transglycosylase domain-containing protein [Geothrix sp.]NWJ40246.1 transglycosylase domain-containing protein [Geothrix sp.]WIL21748.1 MAG: transglycosylase domain-containing protein [Geothrix sp.]
MSYTPSIRWPRLRFERRGPLPPAGPGARAQRRWIAFGAALALGIFLYLGALTLLRTAPARRALRERAVAELARRLPDAHLEGAVGVDAAFQLVMGPILLGPAGDGAPLLMVDRVTVRPRLWRLVSGHLEAGTVTLQGVHIQAGGQGERLADLAHALRPDKPRATSPGPGHHVPEPPVVAFSGLEVRFEGPPSRRPPVVRPLVPSLVFGPLGGRIHLDRLGERTHASIATEGPGRAVGALEVTWGGGPGALRIRLHGLGAEALPESLRADLPFEIRAGAVDLFFEAPHVERLSRGEGQLTLATRNLTVFAEGLAPEPVGPLSLHVAGRLRWDAGTRTAALAEATVALDDAGRAALKVVLSVAARPEPHFELALRATAVDWTVLAASLPPTLAPPRGAPGLTGLLAGALKVAGPLRQPAEWQVDGEVDPSHLVPALGNGGPDLTRPFVYEALLTRGGRRQMTIGPENHSFVPLGELPNHLVRAVLESEDAGFYGHKGFDLSEVQEALSNGGRLRGASTLTQQLAKNLFLSRDRTLSRKVREALATVALEVAVGKRRILEIYLNLAEWGDGVYGIGEAAQHWFGKDARTLSLKEATLLATVIPNPVRYEMYRRRGALTPAWEERVNDLLAKLHTTGVIDDEGLRAAEAETLTFAGGPPLNRGQSGKRVKGE